jgi:hypothetical protein
MATTDKQRFSLMEGLPPADDKELAVLMEAAGRLPAAGAREVIRNLLRAALGYERTGSHDYLESLADAALVTFRTRREAEDQEALDAPPSGPPVPSDDGTDVEEVLARYGT